MFRPKRDNKDEDVNIDFVKLLLNTGADFEIRDADLGHYHQCTVLIEGEQISVFNTTCEIV